MVRRTDYLFQTTLFAHVQITVRNSSEEVCTPPDTSKRCLDHYTLLYVRKKFALLLIQASPHPLLIAFRTPRRGFT